MDFGELVASMVVGWIFVVVGLPVLYLAWRLFILVARAALGVAPADQTPGEVSQSKGSTPEPPL